MQTVQKFTFPTFMGICSILAAFADILQNPTIFAGILISLFGLGFLSIIVPAGWIPVRLADMFGFDSSIRTTLKPFGLSCLVLGGMIYVFSAISAEAEPEGGALAKAFPEIEKIQIADKRNCEPLRYQDFPGVPAVDREDATGSAVIAHFRAFRARLASTRNLNDLGFPRGRQLLKALFRFRAQYDFAVAGIAGFRRVEAVEPDAGAIVQSDGVTVGHREALGRELRSDLDHRKCRSVRDEGRGCDQPGIERDQQ